MSISSRLSRVPCSVMFSFADRIKQLQSREKVIDLSLGQPEVPAPPHIARAFQKALDSPITAYSSAIGSPELRNLVASEASKETGAAVDADGVIITNGSKHALFVTLLSLVDREEEILVHEPYFPPYLEIAELIDAKLRRVPIKYDDPSHIKPDLDCLLSAVTGKTKVILVNYPNNPAGWMFDEREVEKLTEFCSSKGIYLVSDEIYDKIVFDGKRYYSSLSNDSDYVIKIGSFSKTYSMVPYRLGYLISRPGLAKELLKTQRATITMVSPYVQAAGIAALNGPQDFVAERLKIYQDRRDRCYRLLSKENSISVSKPEGAFYFFIKFEEKDGLKFATDLLEKERVAVLPGSAFGEKWKDWIRISFAVSDAELDQAIGKIITNLS